MVWWHWAPVLSRRPCGYGWGHDYLRIDPFWISWLIFTWLQPASIPQTFYDILVGVTASAGIAAYSQGKYLLRSAKTVE
jgi:hypothetical protein